MNTKTRRGRKPSKFSRGRLPFKGIDFILNQKTNDVRQIQKDYHAKFGVWVTEDRINNLRSGETQTTTTTTEDNSRPVFVVKYRGQILTPSEFGEVYAREAVNELVSSLKY